VVHDLTAAWICGIVHELAAAVLIVLADKGYTGAGGHIRVPCRGRSKAASRKDANRATPSYGHPPNAPTPRPGASCANSQNSVKHAAKRAAGKATGIRAHRLKAVLRSRRPTWSKSVRS
jgi:hypothetical protein